MAKHDETMKLKTIPECAKELGVSYARIRRAVTKGNMRSLLLGSHRLVYVEEAREALFQQGVKIKAVMEHTGLTDSAIRRGISEGWLPCCGKDGKAFMFDLDAVDTAIKERMQVQNTEE